GPVCRLREDAEEGAALAELNERFGHTAEERIRYRAARPRVWRLRHGLSHLSRDPTHNAVDRHVRDASVMRDVQHLRKSRQCLLIDAAPRSRPAVTQVPLRTVVAPGDQYAARARRRVPEI